MLCQGNEPQRLPNFPYTPENSHTYIISVSLKVDQIFLDHSMFATKQTMLSLLGHLAQNLLTLILVFKAETYKTQSLSENCLHLKMLKGGFECGFGKLLSL